MLLRAQADGKVAGAIVAGVVGVTALQDDRELVRNMAMRRQTFAGLEPQQRNAMRIAVQLEPDLVETTERPPPRLAREIPPQGRGRPIKVEGEGRWHRRRDR